MKKLVFGVCALMATAQVLAWKPTMHVRLAEDALADALDDGKVSIFRVNYDTGAILGKVGDYTVDPNVLRAISNNRSHYRAGCLGPDAYPDIATGQSCIHPGDDPRDGDSAVGNEPDEGSDAWLQHLWKAKDGKGDKVLAWTMGFFTHAVGDMFAHTFVNEYAGGKFSIGTNGLRHIVLEGYVGKRCPAPQSFSASIKDVEDFIYQTFIRATPGSDLQRRLLTGAGAQTSIPAIFSKMGNDLKAQINAYDAKPLQDRLLFDATHPFEIAYKRAWLEDIDNGLKAWVKLSHELAILAMFNPEGLSAKNFGDLKEKVNEYVNRHLISMLGAPDFVGASREIVDKIVEAFTPTELLEWIEQIREDMINFMFETVFGFTLDDIKDEIANPELRFNPIIGPGSPGDPQAARITLANFNRDVLKINDTGFTNPGLKFDTNQFAPAYNTVVMTKVLYMKASEVNRLISDLKTVKTRVPVGIRKTKPFMKAAATVPTLADGSNIMLGFFNSFDDDNQWHQNVGKNLFVRAGVYEDLFMEQIGEDTGAVPPPPLIRRVTVKITKVKQIDDLDIDVVGGGADFFARVTIDGRQKTMPMKKDDDNISPTDWTYSRDTSSDVITIKIKLYDADSGLRGADDHCDIHPDRDKRSLTLTYNLKTGAITGPVSGTKGQPIKVSGAGDSDRAEITFTIDHA